MDVPNFVRMEQDLDNSMAMLSVDDANIAQQKEMWGKLLPADEKLPKYLSFEFEC